MKTLDECRVEIDAINKEMMRLFEQRMELSKQVVEYKIANNMEIFQPEREKIILENVKNNEEKEELKSYAVSFMSAIIDISKDYQTDFLPQEEMVVTLPKDFSRSLHVGYQGVKGAFGEEAMETYFGNEVQATNYPKFEDVFKALDKDEIKYGIIPIENSSTGAINDVYDLIRNYGFYIVGEQSISIAQHLLVVPGTKMEEIKEVYSHPQGLAQTTKFLDQYPSIKRLPYPNTAVAAKMVSECKDVSKAAIASSKAAELYGLEILQANIHNEKTNHTRFIVIGKNLEAKKENDTVSIVFTLKHEVGSLESILKVIKDNGLNMTRIESRPIEERNWEYYFYVDFEGNILDAQVRRGLNKMKHFAQTFRILGTYQGTKC